MARKKINEGVCLDSNMANEKGPNVKKKQKCKNCEGKGLVKKGDRVVKCQRCGGTGCGSVSRYIPQFLILNLSKLAPRGSRISLCHPTTFAYPLTNVPEESRLPSRI